MSRSALPPLELRHLRTFAAIAETHSLSKAAARLHLTQPAVSHQVKALEDLYGIPLFERKTVPLRLTPGGQRLLGLAREVEVRVAEAERDLSRIADGRAGQLRIAVECHSCFDWLMPSMDAFRERWPEVEMDLVSGFHADPVGLLGEDRADLVIVSHAIKRPDIAFHPLFRYEVSALLAKEHPLTAKPFLSARDFAKETLVTYPIPDDRIDVLREVLIPARVEPAKRRTTELTVAILQLVASKRAVAAMPRWAVQPFLDREYVVARPIGKKGLQSALHAATTEAAAGAAYMRDFLDIMRRVSFASLSGITAL
ncbi:LysR family transcriptional regulator [Roseimicrobium sp. ORNL1]|uniref:LysR family transcriptional regulator n=1 Tax=Roseimicrobium sp. ORNL1 TaxID=2711231 RepID=UPI0013E12793|nr:LysR family transcriptional regulator [Roseimicrobium sp. ORNL1]QIF02246.1 LysR family transcriptional regulator [Roseimicrobium sp. ORNL1]